MTSDSHTSQELNCRNHLHQQSHPRTNLSKLSRQILWGYQQRSNDDELLRLIRRDSRRHQMQLLQIDKLGVLGDRL